VLVPFENGSARGSGLGAEVVVVQVGLPRGSHAAHAARCLLILPLPCFFPRELPRVGLVRD